nr:RNA-directed DNA polymerase, eukaryota, reverse transcriptase zinc-binding domain protein [Tanacetum cinerariifolium]
MKSSQPKLLPHNYRPNKDEFRIKKNVNFMLEFDGATTVRRAHTVSKGFVRYLFQLVDIDNLEPTNNKFLIDVVGYVTNVGRMNQQKTGVLPNVYNLADRLYLCSTSSTLILDDAKIPAKISGQRRAGITRNAAKKNVKKEMLIGKQQVLLTGHRYRLELEVSDETALVVVVMFEETVTEVVKCSTESILELEDEIVVAEDVEETSNSPTVELVIVGPDVFPKEPTLKRLVKSPSIATPSKPAQATKKKWEVIEDSDAEESFAIESRPTCRNAGCSSDMSKRRRTPFNPKEMSSFRSKEDDVAKISTSVYVTNFPESISAKELFNSCKIYRHVVDSFIPSKRAKNGKRFGFVRFINVFNAERLVNNLCTVWIDRYKLQANIARFQRTMASRSYAGVGGNMSWKQSWIETVDKIKKRLSKWKMNTLSIGGRLTLIKSVLGSTPLYHFSLFKVPMGVLNNIESLRSQFFNGHGLNSKKATWVNWKKALASKDRGGVIQALHGVNGWIGVVSRSGYNSCWTAIIQETNSLLTKGIDVMNHNRIKLGNGDKTMFWEDKWCAGGTLKDKFNHLYALESCKHVTVGTKFSQPLLSSSFRRTPRGGIEMDQFVKMVDDVKEVILSTSEDRWVWDLENTGEFSFSSTFNISCRGICIDSILCANCDKGVETSSHLFFSCSMARMVVTFILRWWCNPVVELDSYDDWTLWAIFDAKMPKKVLLFDNILSKSFYWCRFRSKASFGWND